MRIEKELKELFVQKKLTLALAESCTGGRMAARLTSIPGASAYFLGSFVVYSNELKEKALYVREKSLKEKGAVSKEVVLEMLQGLFSRTSADFGIAVSGIAGPTGGSADKPVGTVFAALGSRRKEPEILNLHLEGDREAVLEEAASRLFERLFRIVS
ncbi:MAG: hypothetical protein A2Y28_02065 [Chlamydiae bacterium GWC2_50_10]|nr:MAG: hypothetical protein A2Z85_00730 [Chlamydiae bacterium GWA2_50_15]OGN53920.1 MAG: hypothetical protein A2Y28_02065 [Chlamydiae bacterium GWC2_50_10]OGN55162.1 MAG: hypothetical protein A2098_03040 [Chlamydiae bacterium GWF2_49_8]OGN64614.1 MAG: hypothetical protein A3E26_04285 [Chlamydiae bacterium RIFCSPHIGHO2_12_FULL_49_32]OGN68024.1 MAG: hypothetical protein A3I15_00040 [Chlamydiae bacterium RIFCSPLOWO2_02_FULL_49_12]OGN70586.1 MAG: hypothetical protein A3G30_04695 [Chlamydiae bacte